MPSRFPFSEIIGVFVPGNSKTISFSSSSWLPPDSYRGRDS